MDEKRSYREFKGKCLNFGDLWYSAKASDKSRAKLICGECNITITCLEKTLTTESKSANKYITGIAGGMTSTLRRQILNMIEGEINTMTVQDLLEIQRKIRHDHPDLRAGSHKWWDIMRSEISEKEHRTLES